jgi:ribosomal protein S12 methylthiotransferase
MYSYPTSLRKSFLQAMAEIPKICNYIDMPLQHASGSVLARMQRGGNSDQYRRMIDNIRDTVPEIAIRTTLIAGYPGETDEDFKQLYDFVKDVEFERLGVFTYSDEEGTTGFDHHPKVLRRIAVQRRRELMTLQSTISKKHNRAMIGKNAKVLIDKAETNSGVGRLFSQAPDIDGIVKIKSISNAVPGEFIDVVISGAGEYDLNARPL